MPKNNHFARIGETPIKIIQPERDLDKRGFLSPNGAKKRATKGYTIRLIRILAEK